MKLPQAFHSRRVTEALSSLAVHVAAAYDIAASLDPAKTLRPELRSDEDGRFVLSGIDPSHCEQGHPITLFGANLAKLESVWLKPDSAGAGSPKTFSCPTSGSPPSGDDTSRSYVVHCRTQPGTYSVVVVLNGGEQLVTPFKVCVQKKSGRCPGTAGSAS